MTTAAEHRPLPLRMRTDLQVRQIAFGRHAYWTIKDPLALRYYQFREEEYRLLTWLDGRSSLRDLLERFGRAFAPRRLRAEQLQPFLAMLHEAGLVTSDGARQAEVLDRRRRQHRRQARWGALANPLAIRFRGVDAQPLLDAVYPYTRWLFSTWVLVVCLVVVLAALATAALRFDDLAARLPDAATMLAPYHLLWLAAAIVVCKVLHELGHGLTCRHLGGECHELGLMLLVFLPCLYCNVSDAWMLPDKWRRIAIAAAGMVVEVVLAAVALLLWSVTPLGPLNTFCLSLAVAGSLGTILFNGNPLLRYDGYHILADLVEVPNLHEQSRGVLAGAWSRWILGVDAPRLDTFEPGSAPWLAGYAVLSTVYRWVVLAAIVWACHRALEPRGFDSLTVLLVAVVLALVLMPLAMGVRALAANPLRRAGISAPGAAVRMLLLGLLVAAVLGMPLPSRVTAPIVLEAGGGRAVYVSVPGSLVEAVAEGTTVAEGDVVARLENLELQSELAQWESQRDTQRLLVRQLERLQATVSRASGELPSARAHLADLEQRCRLRQADLQQLERLAPCAGQVLPPPLRRAAGHRPGHPRLGDPLAEENRGAWLPTGAVLCRIGDPRRLSALAMIQQGDIERVAVGQTVQLRLDQFAEQSLAGTIREIAQVDLDVVPRELLAHRMVPTRASRDAPPQPVETCYVVRIDLAQGHPPLALDGTGWARIAVPPQSLAARIVRAMHRALYVDW